MTDSSAREVRAELRHVAVLFADLQGFTRVCERLDPEEVVEILDVIYTHLGVEVERYGGSVDKVLGDGLLVLFGAPQAHADDGPRALLAGLAMQKAMADLQPWIRDRLGQELGLRIGIDAGPVVYGCLGPTSGARRTVIGDAANVAARLQRFASAGQVVLSDRARRLGIRHVECRKLGVVQLDGRAQAVEAFVAVAPRRPPEEPPGMAPIGRSTELQRLWEDYVLARAGKARLVLVSGAAGIGKTRLLSEFVARLRANSALGRPIVFHLHNRWEVGADYRPLEELRSALARRVPGAAAPRAMSPANDCSRAEEQVTTALAEASRSVPVVVLVDDWQWAAPSDPSPFARIVGALTDRPVLLVLAGRAVDLPVDRTVAVHRLRVPPLSAQESWALLQQHPAASGLGVELAEALIERAGGNPADVIESVAALIEDGWLAPSGAGWRARDDCPAPAVPESLRNRMLSHIDALSVEDRRLLQVCAVVGSEVTVPLLRQVSGEADPAVMEHLSSLVDAGLLVAAPDGGGTYRLRSDLVRSVAHDTMLRRERRELHRAVGEALESLACASDDVLATHYAAAGVPDKAAAYGLSGGSTLLARGAREQAVTLLRAIEPFVADDDLVRRAQLLELLGQALIANGELSEGTDRTLQALALVRDQAWRGHLFLALGWAYSARGREDLAIGHFRRARDVAVGAGDLEGEREVTAAMRLLYDRP